MTVDLLEPKKTFVPRPPESIEVIEARWKKKKESIKNLSDNIRKLKVNVSRDIQSDEEKESLTALVVAVLLQTAERIGNDESAKNGHLGATGFAKQNISISGNAVSLDYTGKSGVKHEKCFTDERVAKALKQAIKNSPSKYIFETSDGFRIKSDRVSRYLKPYSVKPKDVRGYLANKYTLEKLNKITPEDTDKKRKKQLNKILKDVAEKVGHGRPTLRKHYLIPELWDEWVNNGKIIDISDLGYMEKGGEVGESEEDVIEEEEIQEEVEINASFNKVDCPYQIFEITSNKKSDVAKIVVRLQVHYDNKEFKDKIFSLDEFKKHYSGDKEFTYYYDWNGFNFPDYTVKSFLAGKFDPLSPEEKWLIGNIKADVDLSKPYYIVGYSDGDEPTINHERAHALYYLSPEYRSDVDVIIDSIPKSELGTLNEFLKARNYHPSVYKDEMQAYLMADKDYLIKYGGWSDSYELDHQELRIVFDKYFGGKNKMAKGGKTATKKSFKEYYSEDGWLIF